ncbi:MAG: hypothetical protein JKP90_23330 [Desulfofustis sp. PB-SRB1]|nr:hypothetical protein [Desulfofustis sp. PB-SRB1]
MLKPLAVVNPMRISQLSQPLAPGQAGHKKYLGFIRAVAFLHQYQREIQTVEVDGTLVEYIEVTLTDIETANRLANVVSVNPWMNWSNLPEPCYRRSTKW